MVLRGTHSSCDTSRGSVGVVVTHKPCTSSLDFIKGVYVLDVRVPDSGCIVESWLYHSVVGR